MPKSFKSFTKEYALGLQVPATSYLKPTASMNLQAKKKIKKEKKDWITTELKRNLHKHKEINMNWITRELKRNLHKVELL